MAVNKPWAAQCAALVIPYTAAWHHMVFYRPTCLLNPFGPEYNWETVSTILMRDPSLAWALLTAIVTYFAGLHARIGRLVQLAALPVFIGFIPVSLWVWDIPFAGRPICRHWHDGKLVLPLLGTMRGTYLYVFGLAVSALLTALRALPERAQLLSASRP